MKVLDDEPYAWILFEHEGRYLLDANCNHGAFGYSFMIELNEDERALFESGGWEHLNKLAYDIHYSVPILKNSTSIYKERDVTQKYLEKCSKAIDTWRSSEKNA